MGEVTKTIKEIAAITEAVKAGLMRLVVRRGVTTVDLEDWKPFCEHFGYDRGLDIYGKLNCSYLLWRGDMSLVKRIVEAVKY